MPIDPRIAIVRGSVLDQNVDAVVNAANTSLRGGGGLDGQVHRRAGREMVLELMRLAPHGCQVGQVVVTPGFGLAHKWVAHVAGPVWQGGTAGEAGLLETCYRNSFLALEAKNVTSIGFCGISAGIYGYPLKEALGIGLRTVDACLAESQVDAVVFALFRADEFEAANEMALLL